MEDEQTLRWYITCDVERCGKRKPANRCSKCKLVYYCSQDCQKTNWKRHKAGCFPLDEMKRMHAVKDDWSKNEEITFLTEGNSETAGPCGICLEDTIVDPVVFKKCKHAFCCSCLVHFQNTNKQSDFTQNGTKCPYCRTEIPDLVDSTNAKICVIVARVERGDMSEGERKELATKALADIEKLCDIGDPLLKVIFTHNRATLLSCRGDHNAALKGLQDAIPVFTEMAENGAKAEAIMAKCIAQNLRFTEEIRKHNLGAPGSVPRKTDLINLYFNIAKVQKKLEDWDAAAETYKKMYESFQVGPEMNAHQQREVFLGAQECAYQMKDYRYAMQLGDTVMKTNRFYPGVHKSTALAYRAIGKVEEARVLAARVVLYETPWDEENKKNNWKFWKEYNGDNIAGPEVIELHSKHCFVNKYPK